MAYGRPVTIISDVHYGYPGSRIRKPSNLAPIFEQSRLVIFNGDTVEQREPEQRNRSPHLLDELTCEAARHGCETRFLTGNHDPAASECHHADLCDGALLVTHGDVLFDTITPWASGSGKLRREYFRVLDELSLDETELFERHLRASKQVSLVIAYRTPSVPPNKIGRALLVLREVWPPHRPLRIIKAWIDAPAQAFKTLDRFRPEARVIAYGHVHFPGLWRDDRGRVAVNTGSFTPPFGASALQIDNGELVYRKLKRGKTAYDFAHPGTRIRLGRRVVEA